MNNNNDDIIMNNKEIEIRYSSYTEAQKRACKKYYNLHRETILLQNNVKEKIKMLDPEYRKYRSEITKRCKDKKQQQMDPNIIINKKRGRPKKQLVEEIATTN
jgi:hypothetical protein